MNKTYIPKNIRDKNRIWYLIDAQEQNLGRLSTQISILLRGKNDVLYTPNVNSMNYIIVINAKYINITGQKRSQKIYKRHSGRPGGLKMETFNQLNHRIPARIIEKSIRGMLPHNALGRQLFKQLKIYGDKNHPHAAQKPTIIELK
uniref:Ribosomal protein L13 n=1 Tax=Riquetophycus sp. TaxID=1897556 RepID=A0A1C9C8G5_9FLOR|nr:ribosomal protein L13 [Riquetophycus sp.]